MIEIINIFLLTLLATTACFVVLARNLFSAIMLTGIYSLLSAGFFLVLDAVDVSFTEAAVGGGISTILMLGAFACVGTEAKPARNRLFLPLLVVVGVGGVLLLATLDMPHFGDPAAPVHSHVAPHYLNESAHEVGPPNVVTSVLASYRGFDTLGEVTVVFVAGIGVAMLLGSGEVLRHRRDGS